jgi:hypothetical protein
VPDTPVTAVEEKLPLVSLCASPEVALAERVSDVLLEVSCDAPLVQPCA